MKKILIIAYHFPPDSEVGGIRPAKIAKYIKDYGWIPYVLTVNVKYYDKVDINRGIEVKDTNIRRTVVMPTVIEFILCIKRMFKRKNVNKVYDNISRHETKLVIGDSHIGDSNIISKFKRILDSIFEMPDKMIGWLIPAVWTGYKIIKREKIEVIFSTAPPATVSLIGLVLAKLTRVKLIIDLRDPFYLHEGKPKTARSKLSDIIERWLEKKIVNGADLVTTTNQNYTDYLKGKYIKLQEDKFITIWNGFDSSDFEREDDFVPDDKMVIKYIGTFYMSRTPEQLFKAIRELIDEKEITIDGIKIDLIGDVKMVEEESINLCISKYGLSECVNIKERVNYKEALKEMQSANVLLLLAPKYMEYAVPAKTFEYMYANRYILCLTSKGATADLLKKIGCGIVVDQFDIAGIKGAIKRLYMLWDKNKKFSHDKDISQFEREQQTSELARGIDRLF